MTEQELINSEQKKKALLIAKREALRFRYVTELRTKINQTVFAIIGKVGAVKVPSLSRVAPVILGAIQTQIPLKTPNGDYIAGFSDNDMPYPQSEPKLGLLSPMTEILTRPLNLKTTEPGYWIEPLWFKKSPEEALDLMEFPEFSSFNVEWMIEWAKKANQPIDLPAFQNLAILMQYGTPHGKLKDNIEEAKNLLIEILKQTQEIIEIELKIRNLKEQSAEKSLLAPTPKPASGTIVSPALTEKVQDVSNVTSVVSQKNFPYILAALAALLLIGRRS